MSSSKSPVSISYKRPFYSRTRFLFFALLLIAVYSYGWRVTQIELGELVRDVHLVKPLIQDLLRPDIINFKTKTELANTYFSLSHKQSLSREQKKSTLSPVIILSINKGQKGDRIRVFGSGFRPNEKGKIIWINSIDQEYPLGLFETNLKGSFESSFTFSHV